MEIKRISEEQTNALLYSISLHTNLCANEIMNIKKDPIIKDLESIEEK